MQSIYFVDSNFTYESSKKSILSIRYATDGFSFCVHDEKDKLVVFVHEPYAADSREAAVARLKNYVVNDAILNLRFKKVYIMPCFKEKLLVPGAFFDKTNIATLYAVNQEVSPDDTILYHHIEGIEAYLVETVISSFHDFVREHFSVVQIVNGAYPFILGAMGKALRDTEQIFLDIQDHYFDLLFIQDSRIQLFNSFSYKAMTDIVYFVLNCIKECEIKQEKIHLSICGPAIKDNKLQELLSLYLPNPYFAKEPLLNGILHDKEFNSSHFTHLLNLHRCGL